MMWLNYFQFGNFLQQVHKESNSSLIGVPVRGFENMRLCNMLYTCNGNCLKYQEL